jgi:hypothetical protein
MEEKKLKEAKKMWRKLMHGRTTLLEGSTIPELKEEATKIREAVTEVLNQ